MDGTSTTSTFVDIEYSFSKRFAWEKLAVRYDE